MSTENSHNWLELLTAASTAAAALFAAFTAWTSKHSVKAAKDALEEARLARRTELAPRIILEKNFLDFHFYWPHVDSLNGEAVFLARKHWQDKKPIPPTFSLQNFGQSPAIELTIVWELDDPNGELRLPDGYDQLGLTISTGISSAEEQREIKTLMYSRSNGGGAGLPLYRKWTTDIPNCSPGQLRTIDFPQHILNTLFARGLQLGSRMPDQKITLTATISCYSVDNLEHVSKFCWQVIPFHHGQINPILVYGHFIETPLLPKPKGLRVG